MSTRFLLYEADKSDSYADYGQIVHIINDKSVNINMGGQRYEDGSLVIIERVAIEGGYVPVLGDWVLVEWKHGQPIAQGNNSAMNTGLTNINESVKVISTSDVASNTISTNHIRTDSIEARHIRANQIDAEKIVAKSITANEIKADTITANEIASKTITAEEISANTITAIEIQARTITAEEIATNTITANEISANTITAGEISANTITANEIASKTITAEEIKANTITANEIFAGTITGTEIKADTITGQHIISNSIDTRHLKADTIEAGHIKADQINATHISTDAIEAKHISANAVEAEHIKAGSIDSTKISAQSITTDRLEVGSIQTGLLGYYFRGSFAQFMGTRLDSEINFDWATGSPSIIGQADNFSIRWQGNLFSPESGLYVIESTSDDGLKVTIDNIDIINNAVAGGKTGNITLEANKWYSIVIEYKELTGNSNVNLKWKIPSALTSEIIPTKYFRPQTTILDGNTIITGSISAQAIKVGTITAESGVIADASITTAHIKDANITGAKIANAEIKTAHIGDAQITTAKIKDAQITNAKILSLDAGKITTGFLSASLIQSDTIEGHMIKGQTIEGEHIKGNTIDASSLVAGSITTLQLGAGVITADKLSSGAITSDKIRAGSISAEHISAVGIDANSLTIYNGETGQTLIGGGFLRIEGLDVGVIQSDNLLANGLFTTSSSEYGYIRNNPSGEAILGSNLQAVGGHEIWKINLDDGQAVSKIPVDEKKPVDIAIDTDGTYAYVTVQGDDSVKQFDLANNVFTSVKKRVGRGPSRIKFTGDKLQDMKHFFVLNTDPEDKNTPDSLIVIDAPPNSTNGETYVHHQIVLGNMPYDMVLDNRNGIKELFITMAEQGDIAVIDMTSHDSTTWKVKYNIPISAYGTDNYHGGLPGTFGLNMVVGGDASSQYDTSSESGGTESHSHGGYGSSDGSLKKYTPHGIALSADFEHLYVADYANNEILLVDKYGKSQYNSLTGTAHHNHSPNTSIVEGGGPTTTSVRFRIPVGDSPEFIEVVNGKIFVTLEGSGKMAILDEQAIIDEINAERAYYQDEGFLSNPFAPMREKPTFTVNTINVGSKPSYIVSSISRGKIYVTLKGQNQVAEVDIATEVVTRTFNTGANPKGVTLSFDGTHLFVVNHGGSGDLSFVYPQGQFIGDAFLGLEGGVEYKGADHWVPNRTDWVYDDATQALRSASTVEFHSNEPMLNEGGYVKLTAFGKDYQKAVIEQDIYNVTNYSNGNNVINSINERLKPHMDNTIFYPNNPWLDNPEPSDIRIGYYDENAILMYRVPTIDQYTISYGSDAKITFIPDVVGEEEWVEASYTARHDIYFKPHNASILVAVENSSSPNFNTIFEVDEFVPKFVSVDNQQTSPFTPISDGIDEEYTGLEYSIMTNRAKGKTVTSSVAPTIGNLSIIVDDVEPATEHLHEGMSQGDHEGMVHDYVTLPSGLQHVKIDLGKKYMIGQVTVTHMFDTDRIYHNTKTQVSEDGVTWTTIFDSAVSGEYSEASSYHGAHNHIHYAKVITFPARPVRYIRDYANGWTSVDGLTSGTDNHWTEIKAMGDWEFEESLVYPDNTDLSGEQIATNGIGVVTTDIRDASISMNVQIDFTSWWYMTYIVGPQFGTLAIQMPTMMNGNHFLHLDSPYVSKVSHRHIMPFTPSSNVAQDDSAGVVAGKHKIVIKQVSGKVSIDRLRIEDYQYYMRSPLLIEEKSGSNFTRYKVVAEQAKWYEGQGTQSTYGAFDSPRLNPDSKLPDNSVPIKYRVRVKAELNADGTKEERGTAYVTSAIFETGHQHTHWRMSQSADKFAGNRIETWDSNQPHNTGIQHFHLANGSVRGAKILPYAIMDYHISPYALISESKLGLNHPTHPHGYYTTVMVDMGPPYGIVPMEVWNDNKSVLDSIKGWGSSGTSDVMAREDHNHDSDYLKLNGGVLTGDVDMGSNDISNIGSINLNSISSSPTGVSGLLVNLNNTLKFHNGTGWFDIIHSGNYTQPDLATQTSDGLQSMEDKAKIDGIALGATKVEDSTVNGNVKINSVENVVYTHPTTAGNKHIPSGGAIGNYLKYSASGTATWADVNWADIKLKPTEFNPFIASSSVLGGVKQGTGLTIDPTGVISWSHPTGDGNLHIPATGTTNNNKTLKAGATSGSLAWAFVDWSELTGKPISFPATAHGHIFDDIKVSGTDATTLTDYLSTELAKKSETTHRLNNATQIDDGFHSKEDKAKLDGISSGANKTEASATNGKIKIDGTDITVYTHATGSGNNHIPASGASGNFLKWSLAGTASWSNIAWSDIKSGVPTTFTPSSHTHIMDDIRVSGTDATTLPNYLSSTYATKTELASAGNVDKDGLNVFTNTNTFTKSGLAVKIQPSTEPTAGTVYLQIANAQGNNLVTIGTSTTDTTKARFVVNGDFEVTGETIQKSTQSIEGDMNITGNLNATGNTILGDSLTDQTTVNGDLLVEGEIKNKGKYEEVHRRPLFGIAGDLQFQTDSTLFENIVDGYSLSGYALPPVKSGATRHYRMYVVYSDNITAIQATNGQVATLRISGGTNKDMTLSRVGGVANGRADWISPYFTDLPTGNVNIQASLSQSGNELGIRWIELIAYDLYS